MGAGAGKNIREEDGVVDQGSQETLQHSEVDNKKTGELNEDDITRAWEEVNKLDFPSKLLDTNVSRKPEILKIWKEVGKKPDAPTVLQTDRERSGWGTVKIFVSSTFKDFRQERDVLLKQVMPQLRDICENRKLYLIPIDLQWGIPREHTEVESAEICLEQIKGCIEVNGMPFFIGMVGQRPGWILSLSKPKKDGKAIPLKTDAGIALQEKYDWIDNLSLTEMEIVTGAYRLFNPNALFLFRTPSVEEPENKEKYKYLANYLPDTADSEIQNKKIEILKNNLWKRFNNKSIKEYNVAYEFGEKDLQIQELDLEERDNSFLKTAVEFMKERIEHQYPKPTVDPGPYKMAKNHHTAFMQTRCNISGREGIIRKIKGYISSKDPSGPMLLVGGAGVGKSAIMAAAANSCLTDYGSDHHVFYHFVGAVPGSIELLPMLQRLLTEIKETEPETSLPMSLSEAVQETCSHLSNQKSKPTIIIVDAINQFDDDEEARLMQWVPKEISTTIRCVFSLIDDKSSQFIALSDGTNPPKIQRVEPIEEEEDRKRIVTGILKEYSKQIEDEPLNRLVRKKSAGNPLWLSLALEELRFFNKYDEISNKINSLKDDLPGLEEQVLRRLISEIDKGDDEGKLKSTLCLLEASDRGLLTQELLSLLPSQHSEDTLGMPTVTLEWAKIFAALKPFVRPFGDIREGRFDFYHRSMSKVVREKYYKKNPMKWHKLLADYFKTDRNFERRLEEYPKQLIACKDSKQLEIFLTDWQIFDKLFDEKFSAKLINHWRANCELQRKNLERMAICYEEALEKLPSKDNEDRSNTIQRYIMVAQLCVQAEQFDKVNDLCDKAQRLSGDTIRPKLLADISYLKGSAADERAKLHLFEEKSQNKEFKIVIEHYQDARDRLVRLQTDGEQGNQARLARVLERLAFYYIGFAHRGADKSLPAEKATQLAFESIEKAMTIFRELNRPLDEADAKITKGLCYDHAAVERLKTFDEAEEKVKGLAGKYNMVLYRCYLNKGNYFNETKEYNLACENYVKARDLGKCLFGPTHGKTKRLEGVLRYIPFNFIRLKKYLASAFR